MPHSIMETVQDVMIRRALWMLAASLAYPTAAASLRAGQQPGD